MLKDASANVEAILDFSEEDSVDDHFDKSLLEKAAGAIDDLLSRSTEGRIFREGLQVVLAGLPNVGKSSIFNKLLDCSRSIVTTVPGTTRNTIAETVAINGTVITLVDTAGLSSPRDEVEAEGIRRARKKLQDADIMVPVIDSSVPLREGDKTLLEGMRGKQSLVILNKTDLPSAVSAAEVGLVAHDPPLVRVSAKTGEGIEEFREALAKCCSPVISSSDGGLFPVTDSRHREVLERSLAALERGIENTAAGRPLDMIAADIRDALEAFGEITGETATEDLLDRIFSRFCIGK
jgi:tRNA modification GTPase